MRIALSTSVMQRGRSGVGQYVLALVRSLLPAAADHEFTLYVLQEDLPLFSFAEKSMRLEVVSEIYRPALSNILWHQRVLPSLIRKAKIEVLHVPSYRRMLWPRPCALVATIHDLAAFHLAGKYDLARMVYGRTVARRLALRQDEIIAVSRHTANDLKLHFKIPDAQLTVIHNGINHAQFHPGERQAAWSAVCTRHGISEPFFLYVSRLEHPAKNHVRLIEAFNRFKSLDGSPWKLVLAGSDWHGSGHIHEAIRASPYNRDIVPVGFVAQDELPAWYQAANVFVYPSLFEGFGLPPLEAMACGCPTLASATGALEEIVGDAAGRLEPGSVAQMAAQLQRAATDGSWRADLRKAGLEHARRFNWEDTASATLSIYAKAHLRANGQSVGAKVRSISPNRSGTHPLPQPTSGW